MQFVVRCQAREELCMVSAFHRWTEDRICARALQADIHLTRAPRMLKFFSP